MAFFMAISLLLTAAGSWLTPVSDLEVLTAAAAEAADDAADNTGDNTNDNTGDNTDANTISSISLSGDTAAVSYRTDRQAKLVVAVYDEAGLQLLASGYADVEASGGQAEVAIIIDGDIPEDYVLRGFLADESFLPLSDAYEYCSYSGHRVVITVQDGEENPLSGAEIVIKMAADESAAGEGSDASGYIDAGTVSTDEDGEYRAFFEDGTYLIQATAGDFTEEKTLEVKGAKTRLTFTLAQSFTEEVSKEVSANVTYDDGTAAGGISIQDQYGELLGTTDEHGECSFLMGAGRWKLTAGQGDNTSSEIISITDNQADGLSVSFVLNKEYTVTVSAVTLDGKIVAGAAVEDADSNLLAMTDSNGIASFEQTDGKILLNVSAWIDGEPYSGEDYCTINGEDTAITIELDSASRIVTVSVYDSDENPVSGAEVLMVNKGTAGMTDENGICTYISTPYDRQYLIVSKDKKTGFASANVSHISEYETFIDVTIYEHSGQCGENVFWSIDKDGTLLIYGSGDMYHFDDNLPNHVPWREQRSYITSVVIEEGVTSIGDGAFSGCDNLTEAIIPESVTSIGDSAFTVCSNLTEITIPEGVTSIGDSAFYGCTTLTGITIPESVTSIGNGAFSGCTALTGITIPDRVVSIGDNAFSNCSDLFSISIGNSVASIGQGAFSSCDSLESILLPDSLGRIESETFRYCTNLTEVTIGAGVTSIESMAFSECGIVSLVIPDNVTYIGSSAFEKCELQELTLGTGLIYIGEFAFSECNPLKSLVIPDNVAAIGAWAFGGCSGLVSVSIPDSVISIDYSAFSGCTSLTEVYYGGSEADWLSMQIMSYNDCLTDADIYFADSSPVKDSTDDSCADDASGDSAAAAETDAETELSVYEETAYWSWQMGASGGEQVTTIEGEENKWSLFLVVRSVDTADLLAADNLLYIAQLEYEDCESFRYMIREVDPDAKALIYISEADVVEQETEAPIGLTQTITASVSSAALSVGDTLQLAAATTGDGALSFSSSDTDVASVDDTGIVTALSPGSAVIAIMAMQTDTYNYEELWVKITVTDDVPDTEAEAFSETESSETEENHTHTWGDWMVVSEASIDMPEIQTHTCTRCGVSESVEVGDVLTPFLELSTDSLLIQKGQITTALTVSMANGDYVETVENKNSKKVSVASDSDGVFTIEGLKTGEAKVTITLHSGLSTSFTVKVQKKAVKTTEISGLPEKVTLTVGEQLALEPVVVPVTSLEGVTYKSSKEKVAAVSDDGIITAVKAGKAKITVKSGSKKFVVTVKVTKQ